MPSSIYSSRNNFCELFPIPQKFTPLADLCMPLQPRRTWSAEDERRRRLEEDPDAYDVGPHTVTCAGCHRPIRLNATGRYYAANWNKHKMGCKNTNAVNGPGATSAQSKFTGRVAAFRVAKPTEIYEPLPHASSSNVQAVLDSDLAQTPDSLHLHPSARESMRSWADQQSPNRVSAMGYHPTSPLSLTDQRTSLRATPVSDRPSPESLDRHTYIAPSDAFRTLDSEGSDSSPRSDTHRSSLTPSGPSPRFEKRESYGPTRTPLRERHERYGQDPRATSTVGHKRFQEEPTPRHRPEDAFYHPAYPSNSEALHKSQRILDKHSSLLRESHPRPEINRRSSSDRNAQVPDDTFIGQHSSPEEEFEPKRLETRNRYVIRSSPDSYLGSSSAASSPEFNASRMSRSAKHTLSDPQAVAHSEMDDRTLPPLSSLTLSSRSNTRSFSRAISNMSHRNISRSKERSTSSSFSLSMYSNSAWHEQTRPGVRAETAWGSYREAPESVVLPPIRTATSSPRTAPSVPRPRQRGGDHDDISMDEDTPSPAKILVLPMDLAHASSSTLRADDLSLKYRLTSVSSDEATDAGGDSKAREFVGNQSEPGSANLLDDAREKAGRLHPVWKWERKDVHSGSNETKVDDDITMDI